MSNSIMLQTKLNMELLTISAYLECVSGNRVTYFNGIVESTDTGKQRTRVLAFYEFPITKEALPKELRPDDYSISVCTPCNVGYRLLDRHLRRNDFAPKKRLQYCHLVQELEFGEAPVKKPREIYTLPVMRKLFAESGLTLEQAWEYKGYGSSRKRRFYIVNSETDESSPRPYDNDELRGILRKCGLIPPEEN